MIRDITQQEKENIYDYIQMALSNDMDFLAAAPVDKLLRYWDRYKEFLYDVLGENLMLKKRISLIEDTSVIGNSVQDVLNGSMAYQKIRAYTDTLAAPVRSLLYPSRIKESTYIKANCVIPLPSGKDYKVQKGTKYTTIFKKLAKELEIPDDKYELLRVGLSRCYNQEKVEGNLVLSIHPLDFLTLSDNASGWTSCFSMKNGVNAKCCIDLMNSPYVLIAYVESDSKKYDLFGRGCLEHEWNSKKWRNYYLVNRDMIIPAKSYPYVSDKLDSIALDWIKDLMMNYYYGEDIVYIEKTCDGSNGSDYISIGSENEEGIIDVVHDSPFNNFDEIGPETKCYVSNYFDFEIENMVYLTPVNMCVCCGEDRDMPDDDGTVLSCSYCREEYSPHCVECLEPLLYEHERFEYDGELYCSDCICMIGGEEDSEEEETTCS